MQIACTQCKKAFNIPDDKIPKDQAFNVGCPACKAKIKVDQHLKKEAPAPPTPAPAADTVDAASMVVQEDFSEDDELKIYGDDDKVALLLDSRHKDVWTKFLGEKEYHVEEARSPEHAVHKIKITEYDLVILDEAYGNQPLEKNAAYQNLLEMPMTTRRKIFLIMVGGKFKTMNNMQAFQYSANLVINENDLDKLPQVIKKALNEHETFYKVFKESLHALGKS